MPSRERHTAGAKLSLTTQELLRKRRLCDLVPYVCNNKLNCELYKKNHQNDP